LVSNILVENAGCAPRLGFYRCIEFGLEFHEPLYTLLADKSICKSVYPIEHPWSDRMTLRRLAAIAAVILAVSAGSAFSPRIAAQNRPERDSRIPGLTPYATRCDISLPLQVELTPLNQPEVGKIARFRVDAQVFLDPDLIESSWVEYDLPARVQRSADTSDARGILSRTGRTGRAQLGVIVPNNQRYEIRARLFVRLINGRTLTQTAVRQINLGNVPPEGMIGRMTDPDGNEIQVYQGVTVRD
jgi:hypothetical protein